MSAKIYTIIAAFIWTILSQGSNQDCSSNWQLSNLIQMTNVLNIAASADRISENFNYPFGASYFDKKPNSILTISDYQCQSFDDVNFSVTSQVNDTILNIKFQSVGMRWTTITTIVWLTARPDMITGIINTDELNSGSLQNKLVSVNTTAPVKFFEDTRTWYLNFITGMRATSAEGIYDVNTSAASKSENTYTIEIVAGEKTDLKAIQIAYLVFNLEISLFSSGGGFESEKNLQQPIYKKVHKNFVPVNYRMLGFDKIKVDKSKKFQLHLGIDTDYILQASSPFGVDFIRVVYLTIGQKTNNVCNKCNNFIFQEQCVDVCPSFSYPFLGYINGGKSCLTCSPKVHEELNDKKTGCKCISSYIRNGTGICVPDNATTSLVTDPDVLGIGEIDCGANKTAVEGTCVCDSQSIALSGNDCFKCVPGSFKDTENCFPCIKNCISCVNNQTCKTCQGNLIYNSELNECLDSSTIEIVPSLKNCEENKTLVGDECVCDKDSILVSEGVCFKCVPGSFKSAGNCLPCIRNCISCMNNQTCNACQTNFTYNSDLNKCEDSSITSIQKNCGENKTLIGDECVCDKDSILIPGDICFKCVPGSFKKDQNCVPCIKECLSCTSQNDCSKCVTDFSYIQEKNTCEKNVLPSDCKDNQIFINNACQCDQFSIPVNGICFKCVDGTYKSELNCLPCTENCISCLSDKSCTKCSDAFVYNPVTKTCDKSGVSTQTDIALCSLNDNKTINAQRNECECLTSFVEISGACQCPDKFILNTEQNICEPQSTTESTNQKEIITDANCKNEQVFDGQKCVFCRNGTYPDQLNNRCSFCIEKCTYCVGSIECLRCEAGYEFDESLLLCARTECGENEILTQGRCPCRQSYIRDENGNCVQKCKINEVLVEESCVFCADRTFANKQNQKCDPCMQNCLSCTGFNDCKNCRSKYEFDEESSQCLRTSCGEQGTLSEGECLCNELSILDENGDCMKCADNAFKKDKNTCEKCLLNCEKCSNNQTCEKCFDGFEFQNESKICSPLAVCGNEVQQKNEECEDGNNFDNDGCSSDCKIEKGYTCENGTCTKKPFFINMVKIISSGIITEIETLQPIKKQDIKKILKVKIDDSSPQPLKTKIIQPNGNENKIKVFMQYCILPPEEVSASFSVQDKGEENVKYNLKNKTYLIE